MILNEIVDLAVDSMNPEKSEKNAWKYTMDNRYIINTTGKLDKENYLASFYPKDSVVMIRNIDQKTTEYETLADGTIKVIMPCPQYTDKAKDNSTIIFSKDTLTTSVYYKFPVSLDKLTTEKKNKILEHKRFCYAACIDVLKKRTNKIVMTSNDLLLDNKKFAGGEDLYTDDFFYENFLFTWKYDKAFFDQHLTDPHALSRKYDITGVNNEIPGYSKHSFAYDLIAEIKIKLKHINGLFK